MKSSARPECLQVKGGCLCLRKLKESPKHPSQVLYLDQYYTELRSRFNLRLDTSAFSCCQLPTLAMMHKSSTAWLSAIVANTMAAPAMPLVERQDNPIVHLAGDSTMAPEGGGSGTIGTCSGNRWSLKRLLTSSRLG